MKILDKNGKKDYYDFLTGIYGIDEKFVLDRRDYDSFYTDSIITFYIAGHIVECLNVNKKFYYGEDLNKFKKEGYGRIYLSKHWHRDYDNSIEIEFNDGFRTRHEWIYIKPVVDKDEINNRFDCPILLKQNQDVYKYPLLKNFNLGSFIPPETIYKWLEEWLSNRISKLECSKELPNDLKIESKGFDKVTSFRPKIKNNV